MVSQTILKTIASLVEIPVLVHIFKSKLNFSKYIYKLNFIQNNVYIPLYIHYTPIILLHVKMLALTR
jgi:hypothetical protein